VGNGVPVKNGPALPVFPEVLRRSSRSSGRNIAPNPALLSNPALKAWRDIEAIEATMATRQQDRTVETPTEARQAEPGPSVLALLVVSTGLAVLILGVVWFVFFRT
jgi:hypothetical protein